MNTLVLYTNYDETNVAMLNGERHTCSPDELEALSAIITTCANRANGYAYTDHGTFVKPMLNHSLTHFSDAVLFELRLYFRGLATSEDLRYRIYNLVD